MPTYKARLAIEELREGPRGRGSVIPEMSGVEVVFYFSIWVLVLIIGLVHVDYRLGLGGMDWYKSFIAIIASQMASFRKNLGGQIPLGFGTWRTFEFR